MARPTKVTAEYFSHDANMRNDLKIRALRRKYGATGYAVWCMLLELIVSSDYLRFRYDEINQELIAADFDVPTELLQQIVNYCTNLQLIKHEGGFLYSETLQNRLSGLFKRRKVELNGVSAYNNSTEGALMSAETVHNTYIKQNEIKQNEIISNKLDINKIKQKEKNACVEFPVLEIENESRVTAEHCYEIMDYFNFSEITNPDKLHRVFYFLRTLEEESQLEQFFKQFEAYKLFKQKSGMAIHSFPRFLGTQEKKFADGGWNQENWTAKLESLTKKEEIGTVAVGTSFDEIRKKLKKNDWYGEC